MRQGTMGYSRAQVGMDSRLHGNDKRKEAPFFPALAAGGGAEGDVDALGLAAAVDGKRNLVARLMLVQDAREAGGLVDGRAIHLRDDIACLHPSLVSRATGNDGGLARCLVGSGNIGA